MNQRTEAKQSLLAQMRAFLRANAMLFVVAAVALLLIADIFGTHGVLAMRRSEKQMQQLEGQIEQLNKNNQQLGQRVKSLKEDPTAVEHIAREEMGLAKPGEFIFKVAPRQSEAAANQNPSAAPKP